MSTLAEVKKYIGANQHLPGVPSAEQVAGDGIDLLKMNATLLEKVEELTLYSIQLEEARQQDQKKLQALEQKQAELEQLLKQVLSRK
ncbi:hypothetical protein [Spirosoma foliorum]|uniref:Uncharacterized protein n=1 Tax=Spirosoma foliorum TaxID=2710596 RepID=A0A7G5GV06_9BACT|nr:hypothetical protein [Spirosoma foliorum]QMW02698.1 hypothetical protein H3H32_33160 [Spirosoma foliorum]